MEKVTGAKFGDCKCGHGKSEHSQASLFAPRGSGFHNKEAAHAPPPAPVEEYHGPCDHYNGKFAR